MSGNNKTALIIGGSRGIGRKIAEKLSDRGHSTIVTARNEIDLSDLGKSYPGIHTCVEDASEDGIASALRGGVFYFRGDLCVEFAVHQPITL